MSEEAQDNQPQAAITPEEVAPKPAQSSPNAADPLTHLREQAVALVPEEARAQMASILRSIVDLYATQDKKSEHEESPRVRARYSMLPVRPKVTRDEGARIPDNYDQFRSDE